MADAVKPPFCHLVIDANAIIAGAQLRGLAEHYWTVAEALAEIRDSQARQALQLLPFKLETRLPSDESIEAVRKFAIQTGDVRTLSQTDLLLLALTYQLEKQENGTAFVRLEPPTYETKAAKLSDFSSGQKAAQVPECRFYRTPGGCRSGDACRFRHVAASVVTSGEQSASAGAGAAAAGCSDHEHGADASAGGDDWATVGPGGAALPEQPAAEDDGEGEWIGPTGAGPDFETVFPSDVPGLPGSAPGGGSSSAIAPRKMVACITTDFAMQNTLLQQGLLLASHSGKVVTSVKQWVLKCDACFAIWPTGALTSVPDSLFCKKCGNATLARLGVTLGADGTPRYHYKKNRAVNTRGTIYSIPAPKGGRLQDGTSAVKQELLLRGDQLLMGGWKDRMRQETANTHASLLADRTIDDRMLEALGTGAGRAAARAGGFQGGWIGPCAGGSLSSSAPIAPGWGRKNPNSNRTHKHRK